MTMHEIENRRYQQSENGIRTRRARIVGSAKDTSKQGIEIKGRTKKVKFETKKRKKKEKKGCRLQIKPLLPSDATFFLLSQFR